MNLVVKNHLHRARCTNAEAEIPDWNWDKVEQASQAKWEDVLGRVELPASETENADVVELLYSSVCYYTVSLSSLNDFFDLALQSFPSAG